MSVYVDDMFAQYGRMKMCHMFADSIPELLSMASKLGLEAKWIQDEDDPVHVHFDVSKTKRELAIEYGAIEISYPSGTGELLKLRREVIKKYDVF